MAYPSLYLFIFLSFHHISSSISARVIKFCIHLEDNQVHAYYCKQNQGGENYFAFGSFSIFSYISHSKVMNMEIFIKDFLGTT